jgi:hypothetical protein
VADERVLVRQTKPARRSPTGNDERARVDDARADNQFDGALAEVSLDQVAHVVYPAEALRLLAHVFYQLRSLDAVGKSGKVFDERGHGKLTAGLVALNDERLQIGARRVESGCMAGATGADDDDIANVHRFVYTGRLTIIWFCES